MIKNKRKNNNYSRKLNGQAKRKVVKQNNYFNKCQRCPYFPHNMILTSPYETDQYGVKHRDIHYVCLYDLHEILPKKNQCSKGCFR